MGMYVLYMYIYTYVYVKSHIYTYIVYFYGIYHRHMEYVRVYSMLIYIT